ncbi:MAG: hypothetical protein E6G07_10600 [Actinobacteria bacterium]|nr:MAG: hypothetical protein E6G53_14070 [Actinomycetota bacterium]TML77941.1 MAG: hypothetical protein E6G07_10600 [Actinomycetota bacterium]
MHAVVVRVSIKDGEEATRALQEQVVPAVSQAPGFVAGYWTRKDDGGLSMIVFESEDAARSASERIRDGVPDSVDLEGTEVREVVAHA